MVRLDSFAAIAAALLPTADAIYTKSSPVLQVDHKSYDSLIAKSNHTSIVEFYAPWCGHCQSLKPAYEKAAKSLSGLAKVAAVDCDEEANKPLCGSMGVKGFPTLKIVRPGKKPGKPSVEDYQGQRSAKAIVDAVVDKIPNHVKRLKDSDYAEWVAEGGPKAILFTDKGTVSALLKSIAIDFLGGIGVGQIRDKETEAVEAFGIDKFPALVLLPGDGKEPVTYNGELKKEPMVKFLAQAADPNPDPAPKQKSDKPKTNKSKASQTKETIVDDPSDSPKPQIPTQKPAKLPEAQPATVISSLQDGLSLQQKCLNDKSGTCVLVILPEESEPSVQTIQAIKALSELHQKHDSSKRSLFPFYQIPSINTQGAALRKKLELSATDVEVIAINGKRGWWRHYPQKAFALRDIEDWVDAIRMGDGKKLDVPTGLLVDAASLPAEPVQIKIPKASEAGSREDMEALKEKLQGELPEGMEYELEEISDEEYEKLMNQGKDGSHDEL